MRIGIGYDIHRLVPSVEETSILLGGVAIPSYSRVESHSDGDVLLHALIDACLGALALGDIGQWFPDTDPKNQNRSSLSFLSEVLEEVRRLEWRVQQMDCTIHLEKPKVAPHCDAIRRKLALALSMELSSVSVKAKTAEGLGPVGQRQAVAANVAVILVQNPTPRG